MYRWIQNPVAYSPPIFLGDITFRCCFLDQRYPHYILTYCWQRGDQEMIFFWPASSLFAIFYINLWFLGHFIDSNGIIVLINIMCDMTRFVVVVPVPSKLLLHSPLTSCNIWCWNLVLVIFFCWMMVPILRTSLSLYTNL